MIKVSTIVAVRNAGESLYECVQTLLEQTLPDTEILLVDDASEDVTPEVIGDCCAQFPEDIRGAYLETPAGLGGGRNRGLQMARGEYVAFFGQADRADPEWLETLYEAARGADMAGSDYYSGVQKVSAGYPEDGDLSGEDSKAAFAASGGELESRIYRRGFLEENDLRFPENNPFFAHYFNFMTALCAHTAVKAEGVYYRRRADAAIQRNDPAAYARLEIPGQILRDCRERDIYAAKKDLIDYKYIAMQMGNIRNVCLGLFDRPDMARLAAIREEILTLCPDYADGKYYGRTLWQLRFYLDKLMQSPEEAAKAFKKDGWLELRAAIRARRGKN